jgi:hypothetical protein
MKRTACLVAAFLFFAPLLGATAQQSEASSSQAKADIMKMAAAGVGDDVLLAYVRNTKAPFHLSADDIIALKTDKVGSPVIEAILNHDAPASADASPSPSAPAAATMNADPGAPPAPLVEAVPVAPGPDYEWVPGYWLWGTRGWVWVYGAWQPYGFFGWHHRRYYW